MTTALQQTFTLGLDVGYSHTKACVFDERDKKLASIRSPRGNACWPSYLGLDSKGAVVVAEDAYELYLVEPSLVAHAFKADLAVPDKKFCGGKLSAGEVVTKYVEQVAASAAK